MKTVNDNTISNFIIDSLELDKTNRLFKEVVFRCQLSLPTSEEELKWFEEGVDVKKSGDFIERVFQKLQEISGNEEL